MRISAGDVTLNAEIVGDGFPVLFLHGSGPGASGVSNFAANAEVLAPRGFSCILLDSLGYGASDKPTDRPYTLEVMAGAAAAVMAALGHDRYAVVGNSQGGAQAIRLAVEHPDRVDKLVLMAPGGLEDRETYMAMPGIQAMMRCVYKGITVDGMRALFAKQLYDPSILPERVVAERTEVALAQPRHVFETLRVDDQRERLADIRCPVLCFWGMDDLFCPPSGAMTIARGVADATVILLTRCGHWVMVERPDVFDRELAAFLTS